MTRRAVHWESLGAGARLFRLAHVGWGILNVAGLAYVWLSAATRRRDRLLAASVGLLGARGVALVIGRGNCPFAALQRRLGDPVPMFELLLPPRAARVAIRLLTIVTLARFAAVVARPPVARGSPPAHSQRCSKGGDLKDMRQIARERNEAG